MSTGRFVENEVRFITLPCSPQSYLPKHLTEIYTIEPSVLKHRSNFVYCLTENSMMHWMLAKSRTMLSSFFHPLSKSTHGETHSCVLFRPRVFQRSSALLHLMPLWIQNLARVSTNLCCLSCNTSSHRRPECTIYT